MSAKKLNRRSFLKTGSTALGATALTLSGHDLGASETTQHSFRSDWPADLHRPWPGEAYWSNPLQDWQIHAGRLECIGAGGDRNVALLTRNVAERDGTLTLEVDCGPLDDTPLTQGFVGFRLGIKHQVDDYRAAAIYGQGMNTGVAADGRLFIGDLQDEAPKINPTAPLHLALHASRSSDGYIIKLRATHPQGDTQEITRHLPGEWLHGGLALVCSSAPVRPSPVPLEPIKDFSFYPPQQQAGGTMRFWFANWTVAGSKVDTHDDRAYGPILFTLYTVSRNTLKLSAQFPPLGNSPRTAALQLLDSHGRWQTAATAEIDGDAWNCTFRVHHWDAGRAHDYRVLYQTSTPYTYRGTIPRDPADTGALTIGLLTCMWDFGFPHNEFSTHLAHHQPDVLLWTGDQIYEPVGGFGVIASRSPELIESAMLDFLRKWYIFGWAAGGLTRAIPSVCMTDDHDMFHGNIWGCGGRPTNPAARTTFAIQDSGGYKMAPRWVNMVQRAQTAHLPDPADPSPIDQGIGVYFTDLQWGGVSFAILEDRKWKSAPREKLPGANIENGFPLKPAWNAATQSNVADAELLGPRQLAFLEKWAADWRGGTWMKFAVSQTIFGCLHTEPPGVFTDNKDPEEAIPPVGVYVRGDHLVADHDSGAWPQRQRDAAIREWRKGFAAHLCGDQHLGTTGHYGVEQFRDGVYSICTPAISSIWPRRWFPPDPAPNAQPGMENTGDYLDAFGNRMSVFAVANPALHPGPGLDGLRYRATGYTILRCDRATRKTTVAMWPRWVDPSTPSASPYPGWPITFDQTDNGWQGAQWMLPPIETTGPPEPVLQVMDTEQSEVVYTLRMRSKSITPLVRKPGVYRVVAYDPDGDYRQEWTATARRIDHA